MAAQSVGRLLARDEAAKHLGIAVDELDQLRRAGTGPEWGQWRSTIRYDVDELDAWVAASQRKTHDQRQPEPNPTIDIIKRVPAIR